MSIRALWMLPAVISLVCLPVWAVEQGKADEDGWLAIGEGVSAAEKAEAQVNAEADVAEPKPEGPPLPFHSVEGYSGGPITPTAYICNQSAKGEILGKPSVAYTFINFGGKRFHSITVIMPFAERFEFGYAYNWFGIGSLYNDIRKAGLNAGRDHVQLHHFNLRGMILPENSFGLPLPALTAGVHFKYNDGIKQIDRKLNGALKSIGYKRNYGVDFTLTASKTFAELAFGRPVIVSIGLRNSRASQLGLLGFGGKCNTTVEGNVIVLPTDRLALAYEFRQKENPYSTLNEIIDKEDNWHCFSVSYVLSNNWTITGLAITAGNIANARADCSLGVQLKYEF